jgi:outer membrane lipoprotein SlyB
MIRFIVISVLTLTLIFTGLFVIGCETQGQTGALVGSGVGAGIGALASRGSAEGTLIGAAVGGGAGYIVGNEADKKQQKQQMQNTQEQMNSILVNIHNSNGSISTVRLTRSGPGYIGPRGEYYDHVPTEAELRPVYGF